jgi:hypothetical protein
MSSRTEFWRKHPALELAFTVIVTAGWFTVLVAIVVKGEFKFGRGVNAVPITPANDPAMFWGTLGVMLILGIAFPAYNVPRIIRRLNARQDHGDSDPATQP